MRTPSTPAYAEAPESMESVDAPDAAVPAAIARIDFALQAGHCLLVYGWLLGLSDRVESATIHVGNIAIDLINQSWRVRRPDVALHFSRPAWDDLHGFYFLTELPDDLAAIDHLRLAYTLNSGEIQETGWPVQQQSLIPEPLLENYLTTLTRLLRDLPRSEGRRLVKFLPAGQRQKLESEVETLPPPIRFELELCCLLEDRVLLVCGWIFDPVKELKSVELSAAGQVFDLLQDSVFIPRHDMKADPLFQQQAKTERCGLVFLRKWAPGLAGHGDVKLAFHSASSDLVQWVRTMSLNAHESRQGLFSFIRKLDDESAMALVECIAPALEGSPELIALRALLEKHYDQAVQRLPASIPHSDAKCAVYLDQAIPIADKGIFLSGWCYAERGINARLACHCGDASYTLTDNWFRHPRRDVTEHLSTLGIQASSHEHGFTCFVPLKNGNRPYCLSVANESGGMRRMRVPLPEKTQGALQAIRSLLCTFQPSHRELRALMDRQVGPAVQALWATRGKPSRDEYVRSFGARPGDPPVSIIVPLYGRCDLAEYQIALFADDREFQGLDLIYVVDDPAIFEPFCQLCPNLYGIYQIPFTVVYSGENQGFAGANNFGVEKARGDHVLLLNSDVMPKRRGWVGDLLRIYESLDRPGLLGAKLLFEDGSLQHGGMAFRRFAPLGGLWINDHPQKGQRPAGLSGTRQVDAVTAACALVDTGLYRRLGGFSEDYIIGDFEDSDLCLRALMAGRRNYVALDVELYHLERQSQEMIGDAVWRRNLTVYNCWLQNQRWSEVIERTTSGASFLAGNGSEW